MFDDKKTPKVKLEAEVVLVNGEKLYCRLFTMPQSRLSDLLNDDRDFLPIELTDGRTTVVQKVTILRVTPVDQGVSLYEGNDPYEILGVDSTVDFKELRRQYHELLKSCHPDTLAAHDLPKPLIQFANGYTARLNQAFQRICRDRGWKDTSIDNS